jgi:glycosyltransferase involved in cell wall biosynthesis
VNGAQARKTPLIIVGPVPPPVHGVIISTTLVLANPELRRRFLVKHLDTSDHRTAENIARWDFQNVYLGLKAAVDLFRLTGGRKGVIYIPISGGTAGLLRDSLLIHVAALRGWKLAGHLRGSEFDKYYWRLPGPLRWWIGSTLRRLHGMGVMGVTLQSQFDRIVPRERLGIVLNGTPDPGEPKEERDDRTVVFLSNLRRVKGVVEAMETAELVIRERPDTRFLFAGPCADPELERELRERAARIGGEIEFLGRVDGEDKFHLLRTSTLLLFPTKWPEGHPRVILESMACALPIVATDMGNMRETVTDGETAFVLDRPDPRALADRVLQLLGDPELRERMGAAARARYLAEFTEERQDVKIADWLETVQAA